MLKKTSVLTLIVLLMTVSITACSSDAIVDIPETVILASGQSLKSEKPRGETVDVLKKDKADLVKDNGTFAFSLYQEIRSQNGNLLFSPYGISTALAMTYAGANGTTADQMASTLHFELPEATLHQVISNVANYNALSCAYLRMAFPGVSIVIISLM